MKDMLSGSCGKEHSCGRGCGGHRRSGDGRGHGRGCHRAHCRGGAKVKLIVATMLLIYNGLTKLQTSPFNHSLVYKDQQ